MNVIIVDLVWRDVTGLGEDEQGCGVELDTLLQASCSLHPQYSSKERLGGGCSGGGGTYMGCWLKYDSSKLEKDVLCGVSIC